MISLNKYVYHRIRLTDIYDIQKNLRIQIFGKF